MSVYELKVNFNTIRQLTDAASLLSEAGNEQESRAILINLGKQLIGYDMSEDQTQAAESVATTPTDTASWIAPNKYDISTDEAKAAADRALTDARAFLESLNLTGFADDVVDAVKSAIGTFIAKVVL